MLSFPANPVIDDLHVTEGITYKYTTNGWRVAPATYALQGEVGPQGPEGPQGPQGIQGPAGADGAQGIQGPAGADGAQGIQGPAGADGAQGIQGPAGADSTVPGPAGADGAAGPQGGQGPAGADGPQGPAGTNSTPFLSTRLTFAGDIVAQSGVARWYPDRAITLSTVYFSLGVVSATELSIDVLKNGVSVFPGAKPTLTAGQFLSSSVVITTALATTDYLTVNVIGSGGQYLTAVIVYA